jgi:peroxiredoxin
MRIVFAFLLLFAHEALTQSFQIIVQVTSLKANAKVTLTVRDNNQWKEYSSEAKGGKFFITGKVEEPAFAYLVLKYDTELDTGPRLGNVLELFVTNSVIDVAASDSLINAKVTGTEVQSEFAVYHQLTSEWKQRKGSGEDKKNLIAVFIKEHPRSPVGIFAVQNLSLDGTFTLNASQAEPLFDQLSEELKATHTGKLLAEDIAIGKRTAIGSVAPDFTQSDTSNLPVNLKSFRGKYVLIDFWASWCKPCRAENPELVKIFNEFKDKDFTVLSVSLDNSKNNWKKAIIKDHLEWTHVSDLKFWKNEVALLYGVKTVPQNFLLNPEGKIIASGIKAVELRRVLNEHIR